MIYVDSRYADGNVISIETNAGPSIAVLREFPTDSSRFYSYVWKEKDRIDLVANSLLGSPSLWWEIMDFNPEIINPFSIPVGSVLRIPSD
jgi:hypothetical protein